MMKVRSGLLVILLLLCNSLYASGRNILTVYYSWSGNSEKIANDIKSMVGGDILKVDVSTPYTAGSDQELYPIASEELSAINQHDTYPSISTVIDNLDDYDAYIICYPLWHNHMATPMQSFLNTYGHQMAGKDLALFCTSASNTIAGTIKDARRLCPEANFTDSLWIRSSGIDQAHNKLVDWLTAINFYPNNVNEGVKLNVIIDGQTFGATLNDSEAAELFTTLLPLTVDMTDLNNNEKFCWLETTFPGTSSNPDTIFSGDLMIWSSSCLVLYYETFISSYSFIKIGNIDDTTGLASAVGPGEVQATFELAASSVLQNECLGNFELSRNYLSATNPATTIQYDLSQFTDMNISICGLDGNHLETLLNENQKPGQYSISWDASRYPAGIYFVHIIAGNYTRTKKCVVAK